MRFSIMANTPDEIKILLEDIRKDKERLEKKEKLVTERENDLTEKLEK